MKATRHQVDKLTERFLWIAQYSKKRGKGHPDESDLRSAWELQTGCPLTEYQKMDALDFAYHLGYFTRHWGMKP